MVMRNYESATRRRECIDFAGALDYRVAGAVAGFSNSHELFTCNSNTVHKDLNITNVKYSRQEMRKQRRRKTRSYILTDRIFVNSTEIFELIHEY